MSKDFDVTHTPGPWHNNGGRIEAANAYTSVATVVAVVGTINEQTCEDTQNARLIAAAPTLKAQLDELARVARHILFRMDVEARTTEVFLAATHREDLRTALEGIPETED